jgi:hypothetical protein
MDFSEAQRNGFINAFVHFWSTYGNTRNRTDTELRTSAAKLLRGCREHFRANITRISRIDAVIPHASAEQFKTQASALLDVADAKIFLELASSLVKEFPKIAPWISWWL